jgi:hypothetical protein
MNSQAVDQGNRCVGLEMVPEPLPTKGPTEQKPLKYEGLVQRFYSAGIPSARVQAEWTTEVATKQQKLDRAHGLCVAM